MRPEPLRQPSVVTEAPGSSTVFSNPLVERIVVAVVLAVTLTLSFHGLAWWNAHRLSEHPERWNLQLPLDRIVEFSPGWVWIYLSYFPICASPIFLREMWQDIRLFRQTASGYALQFALALPCFLLPFQMARPKLGDPSDWTNQALSWVYQLDPGYNLLPSLHVSNTVFLACWMWRIRGWKTGTGYWTIAALIAWSTLAVKQHYLVDLPTGFLLGTTCFHLCLRRSSKSLG